VGNSFSITDSATTPTTTTRKSEMTMLISPDLGENIVRRLLIRSSRSSSISSKSKQRKAKPRTVPTNSPAVAPITPSAAID